MRTTFQSINGVPVQVIALAPGLTVPLIDLQHLPEATRDQAAIRLASIEADRPFDLRYGPLLRVSLIRLRPAEHLLLLTLHHIVSDAWSTHILVRELTELYACYVEGRSSSLPDLPLQYADFSQWQRAWMTGPVLDRDLAYWTGSLAGELPILDLPTDRPRPEVQTSREAMVTATLPTALAGEVAALSRRMGATPYMTLLSAFFILLSRVTSQTDLIVGTPIANRTRKETEGLIGFFVNTLAIRIRLSAHSTWAEVLDAVRDASLNAYAHQETPFEKLVAALQPKRDISRSPLFQVTFDLQNAPVTELHVSGLEFEPVEIERGSAKFDLSMTVQATDGQLVVGIEYNCDLFDASTIESLLSRYGSILSALTGDIRATVGSLCLLHTEERQAVLAVNQIPGLSQASHALCQSIERQVALLPEQTAVIF